MDSPGTPARRRSPGWVRALGDRQLHGVAMHLLNEQTQADLSERQEWLWDALMSELEYRRRQTKPWWRRCSCELCVGPFEP